MANSGRRSKQKGSSFERKICRQLSLWVSGGSAEDLFWRSSMSGGRATVARKRGVELNRQAGDISAVAPEGHGLTSLFFIELKHYKDLALTSFFVKQSGILNQFWLQTTKAAKQVRKEPMLIARQNNMPTLLIVRQTQWITLIESGGKSPDILSNTYGVRLNHPVTPCEVFWLDQVTQLWRPSREITR